MDSPESLSDFESEIIACGSDGNTTHLSHTSLTILYLYLKRAHQKCGQHPSESRNVDLCLPGRFDSLAKMGLLASDLLYI